MTGIEPTDIIMVFGRHEPKSSVADLMGMIRGQHTAVSLQSMTRKQVLQLSLDLFNIGMSMPEE